MDQLKQQEMLNLFGQFRAEETPTMWGPIETKRITDNMDLFEAMIREAFDGVGLVVGGHHIMFTIAGEPLPQEVASADTLIFDHRVAQKIWGAGWIKTLALIAGEHHSCRDALVRQLFRDRGTMLGAP